MTADRRYLLIASSGSRKRLPGLVYATLPVGLVRITHAIRLF